MNEVVQIKDELYDITGCAMAVLNGLGHGFAEKVYENALAVEFADRNIEFAKQPQFNVFYRDVQVGHYIPDFVVKKDIVLEIKTIEQIGANEIGQVLNYLKATNLKLGLIINFRHARLEWKRVSL